MYTQGATFGLTLGDLLKVRDRIMCGSNPALRKYLLAYAPIVSYVLNEYRFEEVSLEKLRLAADLGLLEALDTVRTKEDVAVFYLHLIPSVRSAIARYVESLYQVPRIPYLYLGRRHQQTTRGDGLLVLSVRPLPQKTCALCPSDYILAMDQSPLHSLSDFNNRLLKLCKGDIFTITYLRNNQLQDTFLHCEV